jgi:tRNA A37 methylthiotransferase MiaB
MKFDRMGCFAYSHEENTHAYLLEDDVPDSVNKIVLTIMELSLKFHGFKPGKSRTNFQMYYR